MDDKNPDIEIWEAKKHAWTHNGGTAQATGATTTGQWPFIDPGQGGARNTAPLGIGSSVLSTQPASQAGTSSGFQAKIATSAAMMAPPPVAGTPSPTAYGGSTMLDKAIKDGTGLGAKLRPATEGAISYLPRPVAKEFRSRLQSSVLFFDYELDHSGGLKTLKLYIDPDVEQKFNTVIDSYDAVKTPVIAPHQSRANLCLSEEGIKERETYRVAQLEKEERAKMRQKAEAAKNDVGTDEPQIKPASRYDVDSRREQQHHHMVKFVEDLEMLVGRFGDAVKVEKELCQKISERGKRDLPVITIDFSAIRKGYASFLNEVPPRENAVLVDSKAWRPPSNVRSEHLLTGTGKGFEKAGTTR